MPSRLSQMRIAIQQRKKKVTNENYTQRRFQATIMHGEDREAVRATYASQCGSHIERRKRHRFCQQRKHGKAVRNHFRHIFTGTVQPIYLKCGFWSTGTRVYQKIIIPCFASDNALLPLVVPYSN